MSEQLNWIARLGCVVAFALATGTVQADEIDNLAGTGTAGYSGDGGPAVDAELNQPFGVVRGPGGDVWFCDTANHCVRRIDERGIISTVTGTGESGHTGDGGPADRATLNEPYEIRFGPRGDLFIVERLNHCVRKVDANSGVITTVAGVGGRSGFGGDGGPAAKALLSQPHSIALSPDGERLFICDIGNHRIRVVDLASGEIGTFSGTGEREPTEDGGKIDRVSLNGPRAIDFASDGSLWLALREGNAVYRLDLSAGTIHHVAGTGKKGFTGNGGPAKEATLSGPKGIAIGPGGDVFLADTESHSIRMIDMSRKPPRMELVAGTGEPGDGPVGRSPERCRLARPHGVFVDAEGNVLVGDSEAHRVRIIRR